MTLNTPLNTSHSERESAAPKKIKESRLMKGTQFKRWALFALLIAVFAAIGAQAQLSTCLLYTSRCV